jgi:hypothetical protein
MLMRALRHLTFQSFLFLDATTVSTVKVANKNGITKLGNSGIAVFATSMMLT